MNNSHEKGKYRAEIKRLFGQPIIRSNAFKTSTYSAYGNDPDKLIKQLKAELDKNLKNA